MHRMNERFQELCGQALDALARAPDGQWIAASEWVFREAFDTLRRETFEAALQARIEAHPDRHPGGFFPPPRPAVPGAPGWRNKGRRPIRVLTASGEVELSRRYFWSQSTGGVCPTDTALGLQAAAVSPGAAELCCTMGLIQDFAQGATDLQRLTGLRVSKERLRQITEREAQAVVRAGGTEHLPPAWTATQARVGEDGAHAGLCGGGWGPGSHGDAK